MADIHRAHKDGCADIKEQWALANREAKHSIKEAMDLVECCDGKVKLLETVAVHVNVYNEDRVTDDQIAT